MTHIERLLQITVDVIEWQLETFKENTFDGAHAHMMREMREFEEHPCAEELADVWFMLSQRAYSRWRDMGSRGDFFETLRRHLLSPFEKRRVPFIDRVLHEAGRHGIVLADAVAEKLEKNKDRTWPSKPDEHGVYEHIKGVVTVSGDVDADGGGKVQ